MDEPGLAARKKNAARWHAHLVFIDETGFLMHPLVRRTWARRGHTPLLRHRTRHHRKISCIGGLSVSPQRRHLHWYLKFHTDSSIRQKEVVAFVADLLRHLRGPVILIWDRLNAHRGKLVRRWLARRPRVHVEYLPPYAPELNPNEYGWANLKRGSTLANACPDQIHELRSLVVRAVRASRRHPALLRSFVRATKLPFRL
jgi:transposase